MTLAHYVLMNKNTPVLSFDYDLGDHKAVRIREVFAPEAAPFGFVDRRGDISKAELNYWWRHRATVSYTHLHTIPDKRKDAAIEKQGYQNSECIG